MHVITERALLTTFIHVANHNTRDLSYIAVLHACRALRSLKTDEDYQGLLNEVALRVTYIRGTESQY